MNNILYEATSKFDFTILAIPTIMIIFMLIFPLIIKNLMESALLDFSDHAGFLFEMAQYYARKCEYEKSITYYEQSWEAEKSQTPRFTDALDGLATIYVIMNNPDKAIETYDRMITCLKSEWGYKDDDAAVIDVERKKKALII